MDVTDDPESPDAAPLDGAPAGGFDLRPRTGESAGGGAGGERRRYVAVAALVALLVALGAVLVVGLNDAATFFRNVVEDSVAETDDGVDFVLTFNSVEVPVTHTGTPPELFGPDIPVVLEGTFSGETFESDEILIRHDNEYDEEHQDRIDEAERDAQSMGRSAARAGGGTVG